MVEVKRLLFSGIVLSFFVSYAVSASCEQLSPSTEVQKNISILQQTKRCPQCDLSGANLIRMDLTDADLEGANLARVRFNLTNLAGANLRNSNLREATFGGADLAGADLQGADLRGTSLTGAYLQGTLLDGELVQTTPYADEQISGIEETVYVLSLIHI